MSDPDVDAVALTALEPSLADAVVSVLADAGIPAWQAPERDAFGDVVVLVGPDRRDQAMTVMGHQMERIATMAQSARDRQPATLNTTRATTDPDDPRSGPPLTMERLASARMLVIAFLAPLLVVTIAGPFLGRQARAITFAVILVGLVWYLRRRGRR